MKKTTFIVSLACLLGTGTLLTGSDARSDGSADSLKGTRSIYGDLPADQAEFLSSGDQIAKVASSSQAPSEIWQTLEHGERVECLNCIPAVEGLLYDSHPQTREIAAWWLRRRMFGVFGPNEAYERTINALKSDPSADKRAFAAEALGEFLITPGVDACAAAIREDKEPKVRAAAARALGRLGSDGNGALAAALGDSDTNVKLGALKSVGRINGHVDDNALTQVLSDANPGVRKRAAEVIGSVRVKTSVAKLLQLAKGDQDAEVRLAACHALGSIGDTSARATLEDRSLHDANGLVRDQARIALRRL